LGAKASFILPLLRAEARAIQGVADMNCHGIEAGPKKQHYSGL